VHQVQSHLNVKKLIMTDVGFPVLSLDLSRKDSDEPLQSSDCPLTSTVCEKPDVKDEGHEEEGHDDDENCGAVVIKAQQWRALLATSIQAFWVVGE
jgi:hypothetical protein